MLNLSLNDRSILHNAGWIIDTNKHGRELDHIFKPKNRKKYSAQGEEAILNVLKGCKEKLSSFKFIVIEISILQS